MPIEIRETIVTPTANGTVVQLHISDAPRDDESATFVVSIVATLPRLSAPALGQIQREVMAMAQDSLSPLLQGMASELTTAGYGLHPRKVE